MSGRLNNIALVTCAPFPIGNVSTLRYSSYMKALSQESIGAHVLIYCPTRMAAHIKARSGKFEDITYHYATDITWKKYNFFNKCRYLIIGLKNSLFYLHSNQISTVILYGDNLFLVHLVFWLYTRFTGKRFIGDRSELPTEKERQSKLKMCLYGIKQRMFDGMIVMTKQLMNFYSRYSSQPNFLYFLPMTIDSNRFKEVQKDMASPPYISVVFGTHNRDGLLDSLKSFDLYCSKGGTYDLWLIGDYHNMPNKKQLDEYILSSEYRDRIYILGLQPNDRVPAILYNSSILLTTPQYYLSGGFPTKLGEYMLSGVPVVATNAGEILDYIEPDIDMLICSPGDYDDISTALLRIENDEKLAFNLATNARNKALNVFSAESYIDSLMDFLLPKEITI